MSETVFNFKKNSRIFQKEEREFLAKYSGIKENVLIQIHEMAEKYDLQSLILFGSRARGDFHFGSDIDLAAVGGRFSEFALSIQEETDTLLHYDIIDLCGRVQKSLIESIISEGIVIYEKN